MASILSTILYINISINIFFFSLYMSFFFLLLLHWNTHSSFLCNFAISQSLIFHTYDRRWLRFVLFTANSKSHNCPLCCCVIYVRSVLILSNYVSKVQFQRSPQSMFLVLFCSLYISLSLFLFLFPHVLLPGLFYYGFGCTFISFNREISFLHAFSNTEKTNTIANDSPEPKPSIFLFIFLCVIFFFAGVTIFVSNTVLSLMIRRVITQTSEAIPLLGSKSIKKPKPKHLFIYHTVSRTLVKIDN